MGGGDFGGGDFGGGDFVRKSSSLLTSRVVVTSKRNELSRTSLNTIYACKYVKACPVSASKIWLSELKIENTKIHHNRATSGLHFIDTLPLQSSRCLTNSGICKPASSSPTTRGLMTIELLASNVGFDGSSSNTNERISTNKMILISANARRYPLISAGSPDRLHAVPCTTEESEQVAVDTGNIGRGNTVDIEPVGVEVIGIWSPDLRRAVHIHDRCCQLVYGN